MIPWLEEIEKIDSSETFTDHGGKRTRPLKYVRYKSASVQLIGRSSKFFKPFAWKEWSEGIEMLKTERFNGIDLQTLCKLYTILAYYGGEREDNPSFGIPCTASIFEDGKILKVLKAMKREYTKVLKAEREKYVAYNKADTEFAGYARLLQSRWREKKGYPIGKSDRGTEYGNYFDEKTAIQDKCNFMTPYIKELVTTEIKESKKSGALISEPRIWTNMLSSQPLCFNLFGELEKDMNLATVFFSKIFPKAVKQVTQIKFEYNPFRSNPEFTGDRSAFDVFVEYLSVNNKKSFIGIEVKYTETLEEGANDVPHIYESHKEEYLRLSDSPVFKKECLPNLAHSPLFQIWRDHLLALSFLQNRIYEDGFFLFLFPYANEKCYNGVCKYCDQLYYSMSNFEDRRYFYWRDIEKFIRTLDEIIDKPWTKEMIERYVGA